MGLVMFHKTYNGAEDEDLVTAPVGSRKNQEPNNNRVASNKRPQTFIERCKEDFPASRLHQRASH